MKHYKWKVVLLVDHEEIASTSIDGTNLRSMAHDVEMWTIGESGAADIKRIVQEARHER